MWIQEYLQARGGARIFLFIVMSRMALGLTHTPILSFLWDEVIGVRSWLFVYFCMHLHCAYTQKQLYRTRTNKYLHFCNCSVLLLPSWKFLFGERMFCILQQVESLCHKLQVIHALESMPSVTVEESVKVVRQHIVCCIISGISFVQHTFKKFIQLQVILNENIDHTYLLLTIVSAVLVLLIMFFEKKSTVIILCVSST